MERVPGTLSIASKSVQVNGAATVSRDLFPAPPLHLTIVGGASWGAARVVQPLMTLWAFLWQELRKPSYAEICQRVKDAQTLQPPAPTKEARAACTAPAGEERKCPPEASIPAGEAKAREPHPPSSKPSLAPTGRPPRDARRPAGRWASPPPHPGKSSSKDPQHTPPKSPQ